MCLFVCLSHYLHSLGDVKDIQYFSRDRGNQDEDEDEDDDAGDASLDQCSAPQWQTRRENYHFDRHK